MKNTKLQNPSLRKRKGFTLIELIVVIAILAILAAIAIPTFIGQLNKARWNTHNANYMALSSAAAVALAENGVPASGTTIQWGATAGTGIFACNDNPTNDGTWDPDKYIDTWPTIPSGLSLSITNYTVSISDTGVIDVEPDKVNASGVEQ